MGRRHTNRVLQWYGNRTRSDDLLSAVLPDQHFLDELCTEIQKGDGKFGGFNSPHELYGIILEELDEFWDSVKVDDPDPKELLQVAAVSIRGALQLAAQARAEVHARDAEVDDETQRVASGKGGSGKWSENTERRNEERRQEEAESNRKMLQRSFDERLRVALAAKGFRFVSKQVGRDGLGVYISGAVFHGDEVVPFKVYRQGDVEATFSDETVALIAGCVYADVEEARAAAEEEVDRDALRDSFKDRLCAVLDARGFQLITHHLGRSRDGLAFTVSVKDSDGAVMSIPKILVGDIETWSDEMVVTIVASFLQKLKDLKNGQG